jgi:hypothetical protein
LLDCNAVCTKPVRSHVPPLADTFACSSIATGISLVVGTTGGGTASGSGRVGLTGLGLVTLAGASSGRAADAETSNTDSADATGRCISVPDVTSSAIITA